MKNHMQPMNFFDRLAGYLHDLESCWEWPGYRSDGYGVVSANVDKRGYRRYGAHRAAYLALLGPVSDELELDHLCRNRGCFNPWHLEPVTPRENTMRSTAPTALNAIKTHCVHGHDFTPENTRVVRTRYGPARHCRRCEFLSNKERYNRLYRKRAPGPVTHCKHGHAFTPENTILRERAEGGRTCLACRRERTRKWMARDRATPDGQQRQREANHRAYIAHRERRIADAAAYKAKRRASA